MTIRDEDIKQPLEIGDIVIFKGREYVIDKEKCSDVIYMGSDKKKKVVFGKLKDGVGDKYCRNFWVNV